MYDISVYALFVVSIASWFLSVLYAFDNTYADLTKAQRARIKLLAIFLGWLAIPIGLALILFDLVKDALSDLK